VIRLARTDDASTIARMSRDSIETGLGWSWRPQRVAASIRDPQSLCIVAGRQSIVGFCITQFGEEIAHLSLLAIEPPHRRRGLATHLVHWMLASARVAGIASVHVEMRAANVEAREFYSAIGFELSAVVPGYYQGREAAQRMVLRLRPEGIEPPLWEPPVAWRRSEGSS
jgi:ribosomal protein S18 acetylase RimI-like enzyme